MAAEDIGNSQATAMVAGEEGVILSNILRHIMPIISESVGTDNSSSDRPNLDEDRSDHDSMQVFSAPRHLV